MIRRAAKIFGIVFLIMGILGFIPTVTPRGMLLGLFHVNALHNIIHLLTGIIAIWASGQKNRSFYFFQIFGIIYGVVAILGFIYRQKAIFGIMANNIADAWLHLAISIFALYLGYLKKRTP